MACNPAEALPLVTPAYLPDNADLNSGSQGSSWHAVPIRQNISALKGDLFLSPRGVCAG